MTDQGKTELHDFSDDDFLNAITQRFPDKQRAIRDSLEKVKSVYVRSPRDKVLEKDLDRFLVSMLAKQGERRDDGRALFITGESGAGKTRMISQMLEKNELLQPMQTSFGIVNPVATVRLMGPCTLRLLGKSILETIGYPIRQRMEQGELWDMLPNQLRQRRVLLIYVDETQHMLRHTTGDSERKNLAKAFKGVMNYAPWPVSFIMSGMPETVEMAQLDEQIERRSSFCRIPEIEMPEGRPLIERILIEMTSVIDMDATKVTQSDLPERIVHTARYQFGRVTQVVLAAIQVALEAGRTSLGRDDFARAYIHHSQARGYDEMNPFLVDDWQRLNPGAFLVDSRD